MMGQEPSMKTVGFKGTVTPNGRITVPAEVVKQVPPGEQLRVVLVWGTSEEDSAWDAVNLKLRTLPKMQSTSN